MSKISRILIIEDDKLFSDDLMYFMKKEGHQCDYAGDAASAIEFIKKINSYDYITMDLMMHRVESIADDEPGVSTGVVFFKMIRGRNKDIPIIVITAKSINEVDERIRRDENTVILTKPITDVRDMIKERIS